MSAHGEETEGNKIRAAQSCINSPEDSDVPWDPPMDDDTVFEAGSEISGDTDLEWDPPSHDDTVLGKFEDMIRWGDEQVDENQFHKAVRLYQSAQRTLADDDHERLENDQLVHSKLSGVYLRHV